MDGVFLPNDNCFTRIELFPLIIIIYSPTCLFSCVWIHINGPILPPCWLFFCDSTVFFQTDCLFYPRWLFSCRSPVFLCTDGWFPIHWLFSCELTVLSSVLRVTGQLEESIGQKIFRKVGESARSLAGETWTKNGIFF